MKAVMMSINPQWCEKIAHKIVETADGTPIYEKSVELRKTIPNLPTPFKGYIYCTKGKTLLKTIDNTLFIDDTYKQGENLFGLYEVVNGKVIGEFVCDEIFPIKVFENGSIQDYICHDMERSCVPYDDIVNYVGKGEIGSGWHISNLVIYSKPRELSEFNKPSEYMYTNYRKRNSYFKGTTRPPQSWCYVEDRSETE